MPAPDRDDAALKLDPVPGRLPLGMARDALHIPVGSHGVSGKLLAIDVDFNLLPSWSWLDP